MFDFVLDAVMKYTPLESWDVSTDSLLREDGQIRHLPAQE